MKNLGILNSFTLKIIAIVTMTIDHLGIFLEAFAFENEAMKLAGTICHYIGRISFPLFTFMAVEGALRTHDIKRYILRLSLAAIPIVLFQAISEIIKAATGYNFTFPYPSIFIALILMVFMVWALENKKVYIKLLSIIPIAIGITSLFLTGIEANSRFQIMIWWFPYMLRPLYDAFGIFLALCFYGAHKLIDMAYESHGMNPDLLKDTPTYQLGVNLLSILGLTVCSILLYLLVYFIPQYVYWLVDIQLFAIIASVFILFYNGKRGYNAKWFKYFSYSYYPVHLVLLFAIFNIIFN